MNKVISVLAILSLISSAYVIREVNEIMSHEHIVPVDTITEPLPDPIPMRTVIPQDIVVPTEELICLQTNIYFESRNQTELGKVGTGWVTLNRVAHTKFPDNICDVVYAAQHDERGNPIRERCQFAWYCDGKTDKPNIKNKMERDAWELSGQLAYVMIKACLMQVNEHECPPDPTYGALFFRSGGVELTDPYYSKTATVQDHTYYALASK